MLRVAVPNKGSLAQVAIATLREAGYRQRTDDRDLIISDPDNGVEFYYLRPRDIAVYVGSGELEAGITGRDLLIDSGAFASEILPLDFGTYCLKSPSTRSPYRPWIEVQLVLLLLISSRALRTSVDITEIAQAAYSIMQFSLFSPRN